MQILKISYHKGISSDAIRSLAKPGCLPRLEELSINSIDISPAEKEQTTGARPSEEAIVAVLDTHQSSLKQISVGGMDLLLSNTFAQACLRLHQLEYLGCMRFAPGTSLELLERLYHHHHQLCIGLFNITLGSSGTKQMCSACLLVKGTIITHDSQGCPETAGLDLEQAENKLRLRAEQGGCCSQCFLHRPLCQCFSQRNEKGQPCQLGFKIRPLVIFLAARNPGSWDRVGEDGDPAYWRLILRFLLLFMKADRF